MKNFMPFIIIAGVLVLAFAVGMYLYNSSSPTNTSSNNNNRPARKAEPGANPPHYRNNSDMKVVVEEFGDFQCPRCAVIYGEVKKIENEFGDKITVIFRQMPLTSIHKFAYDAARASEAAGFQGKFWEMHDILYEKQKDWSVLPDARVEFVKYAQQLGLDVGRFQSDMTSQMVNSRVALDVRRGESMGVTGTPTIFVNGKMVGANEMEAAGLRKYITEALAQVNKPQ
jgi:protein-disulfide isomerase